MEVFLYILIPSQTTHFTVERLSRWSILAKFSCDFTYVQYAVSIRIYQINQKTSKKVCFLLMLLLVLSE